MPGSSFRFLFTLQLAPPDRLEIGCGDSTFMVIPELPDIFGCPGLVEMTGQTSCQGGLAGGLRSVDHDASDINHRFVLLATP